MSTPGYDEYIVTTKEMREYFCHSCGKLCLTKGEPQDCMFCGSMRLTIGAPNELDADRLRTEYAQQEANNKS